MLAEILIYESSSHAHAVVTVATIALEVKAGNIAKFRLKGLLKVGLMASTQIAQHLLRCKKRPALACNATRRGWVTSRSIDVCKRTVNGV